MGLFLRHFHAGHLIHLVRLRRRSRRRLLLGHLHAGHVLHLLIAGNWAALVPLLLLFGSLRQDLVTFLCKIINCQGITKGSYSGLRR